MAVIWIGAPYTHPHHCTPQAIIKALSNAAQHGSSTKVALLRWHKAEHIEPLLCLSMFATAFSTSQAELMLMQSEDIPDVPSLLQVG